MYEIKNPAGKAGQSAYGGVTLVFDEHGVARTKILSVQLARWLRAAGYKVTDLTDEDAVSAFDPDAHKATDVVEYLASADDAERARVIAAEAAGQARKTITGWKAPDESAPTDPTDEEAGHGAESE